MEPVLEDVRPARPGVTPPPQRQGRPGFLSDIVVELGLVDAQTAKWAVEQGRVVGQAVPQVLLDAGLVNEDQLSRATAEHLGLDHVDLGMFDVDLEVTRLISKSAARRYGAVPIAFDDDGTLLIALSDPVDPLAVDDIAVMTKSEVHPMVAVPSAIDAVIEKLHDAPSLQPPLEEPRIEPLIGRRPEPDQVATAQPTVSPEDPAMPQRPAAPEPPAANDEMARMREALADLAARPETAPPAGAPDPAEPAERLTDAERRAESAEAAAIAAERRAQESDGAMERLTEAERRAIEAEATIAEVRSERDQERLRHEHAEQELRTELESAREATGRLEQRLSSVLAATAEIRAACEKLVGPEQQG
jgi:Type II secretion system (T2SS), protein E, N-terminal domain